MRILERIPELACTQCKGELCEFELILECRRCGQRYAVRDGIPNMLGKDVAAFAEEIAVQDRVAQEYVSKRYRDPYARAYHEGWTDQMLARVRPRGRMLDNGCGVGSLFNKVSTDRVVGLDISSAMLRQAAVSSDQLVLGNSQDLPFGDGMFDVVLCRSLLHHLPQPALAIREMSRVLREAGEICLIDTNTSLLSALPRRLAYRGEHFSSDHQNLNRRVLEETLTPYFEVTEVFHFGYLAYPLLGFPDLVGAFRHVPFKRFVARALMSVDAVISRLPVLRTQSWAILMKGVRRGRPGTCRPAKGLTHSAIASVSQSSAPDRHG